MKTNVIKHMSKQLVIIVEGPNKCGKSTLVDLIKDKSGFRFKTIKCSQPKDGDAFKEYSNILDEIENNPDKNYIIDRFHFGSFVYGPIYRGKPDFSLEEFVKIEDRIINLNYIFVLAIASKSFIKNKFISEKEEFAKIELIDKEIELFKKTTIMSKLNIYNHNIPNKDLTKNDKILNIISLNL